MSDENMVEPAFVEFEDFSDEELSEVLDRANNLLQEVLPVALENNEINEDDIVEYNDMRANNMCYQGAIVPPAYHWEQTGLDQEELMQDYVEVFIAYMQEGAEEPQDGDRIFAVVLMPRDPDTEGQGAIAWFPLDYDVDSGFEEYEE